MAGWHWIALAAGLCVAGGCGAETPRKNDARAEDWPAWLQPLELEPAFVLGQPAPDFTLPVLTNRAKIGRVADSVRLSEHLGRVVVLDFWNTGCVPCIAEHETLNEVAEAYRSRGVRFFGITAHDSPESLARFEEQHGAFAYPHLADRGEVVLGRYKVRGWPTKAVIAPSGRVAWWRPGGPIEKAVLVDVIEDVLAGRRPDAATNAAYPAP